MRAQEGSPITPLSSSFLHLLEWRLEAEVFMHGEEQAGLLRRLHDGDAVFPIRREGFLHDGRHAMAESHPGNGAVRVHAGRDVNQPEIALAEHRLRVGVPVRHAEGRGRVFRLLLIDVADGDEIGALRGKVLPGIQVIPGKEAAADQPDRNPAPPFAFLPLLP